FPLVHYAGPFIPLFVLLWLAGVRVIPSREDGEGSGAARAAGDSSPSSRLGMTQRRVIAAVAAFWIFGVAMFFIENRPWRYRWDEVGYRLAVERDLQSRPGRHLVVVRYETSHNPHFEWVENGADIDGAKVVLAHDMPDNAALLRY